MRSPRLVYYFPKFVHNGCACKLNILPVGATFAMHGQHATHRHLNTNANTATHAYNYKFAICEIWVKRMCKSGIGPRVVHMRDLLWKQRSEVNSLKSKLDLSEHESAHALALAPVAFLNLYLDLALTLTYSLTFCFNCFKLSFSFAAIPITVGFDCPISDSLINLVQNS